MAEILSLQYKAVFSEPIQDKELDDPKSFFEPKESQLSFPSKSDIIFSQAKFVKAMESLSPTAAAGRDGFPFFSTILQKNLLNLLRCSGGSP
jgi:hypothetical protein